MGFISTFKCKLVRSVTTPSHGPLARCIPGGCFNNVSRALQNKIAKIYSARNHIIGENFKPKLCTCAQSMALGTRTKFRLEIPIRSTIYVMQKFRKYILESSLIVSEIVRECVLYRIIIIKSEVWTTSHCLGLGNETTVCAVCLDISFEIERYNFCIVCHHK